MIRGREGEPEHDPAQVAPVTRRSQISNLRAPRVGLASTLLLASLVASADIAHGQTSPCQFILGFKTLHDLDPTDVGDCVDNQAFAANGDAQQHTTKGLAAWRKADNWTAFTNGYWTWINGPMGLVKRLNSQRYWFEADRAGYITINPDGSTSLNLTLPVIPVQGPIPSGVGGGFEQFPSISRDQKLQIYSNTVNLSTFPQDEQGLIRPKIPGIISIVPPRWSAQQLSDVQQALNLNVVGTFDNNSPVKLAQMAPILSDPVDSIGQVNIQRAAPTDALERWFPDGRVLLRVVTNVPSSWTRQELDFITQADLAKAAVAIDASQKGLPGAAAETLSNGYLLWMVYNYYPKDPGIGLNRNAIISQVADFATHYGKGYSA